MLSRIKPGGSRLSSSDSRIRTTILKALGHIEQHIMAVKSEHISAHSNSDQHLPSLSITKQHRTA